MRFREEKVALPVNIEAMFNQVMVPDQSRSKQIKAFFIYCGVNHQKQSPKSTNTYATFLGQNVLPHALTMRLSELLETIELNSWKLPSQLDEISTWMTSPNQ